MRQILFALVVSVAAVSSVGCATSGDDGTVSTDDNITAPGSFDLWQATDGQWHFRLVAGNHRILLTSEAYATRLGAINGALSVTRNGVDPVAYRAVQGASGAWLLHLVAGNGEVIGHSETYYSKSNATRAIDACVRAVSTYLDHAVAAAGARAEVEASDAGNFHFNLFAQNGEIILTSESYESEAAALNGAFSAQTAAADDRAFQIETALDGQFYFTLRSANGEIVGVSELYTEFPSAALGIDAVQQTFATVDLL
jgi:uncharacterized protein